MGSGEKPWPMSLVTELEGKVWVDRATYWKCGGHTSDHRKALAHSPDHRPCGKAGAMPLTTVPEAMAVVVPLATEPGTRRLAMPVTGSWLKAFACC